MKFKVGDVVNVKDETYNQKGVKILGIDRRSSCLPYIIQLKYGGFESDLDDKEWCGVKVGTKNVEWFYEHEVTLYKPTNRGKNPRGKDGKFTKKANCGLPKIGKIIKVPRLTRSLEAFQPTLEDRVSALEEKMEKILRILNI